MGGTRVNPDRCRASIGKSNIFSGSRQHQKSLDLTLREVIVNAAQEYPQIHNLVDLPPEVADDKAHVKRVFPGQPDRIGQHLIIQPSFNAQEGVCDPGAGIELIPVPLPYRMIHRGDGLTEVAASQDLLKVFGSDDLASIDKPGFSLINRYTLYTAFSHLNGCHKIISVDQPLKGVFHHGTVYPSLIINL